MIDGCEVPARTIRAGVFAVVAVVLLLALRARSDGAAPPLLVVIACFGLVVMLARPLTATERRWPAVFAGLVATQFVFHGVFLFASTGHFAHAGSAGLFCSPAAAPSGTACLPTERGGVLLLSVQLIAAALFACWVRGAESASWQLARHSVGALVGLVRRLATAMLESLAAIVPDALVFAAPQGDSPEPPRLPLLVREHGRRGPPRRLKFEPILSVSARHVLSF